MPWPPVILARISLPQIIKTIARIRIIMRRPRPMRLRIFFFLLMGFLAFLNFLDFWGSSSVWSGLVVRGSLAAVSSPLSSSKLKAWTGLRKSSTGAGFLTGLTSERTFGCFLALGFEDGALVDFLAGALTDLGVVDLALGLDFLVVDLDLAVFGFLVVEETAATLRGFKPSIDLFLSIVYNYNIMAMKLTKKQLAVLNFLQDFMDEKGYSPSYREIMTGLELSSVSAVAEHIDNLVNKGVLKKVPGAARSLEILNYKHEETVELFKEKMMGVKPEEKEILEKAAEILGLDLE